MPGFTLTTDQREEGFAQGIGAYPDIEYLGAEYSNNEPAQAAEIVQATVAAVPNLEGIFATNLFSAEGSATGLRQANAAEQVAIVGFDAGPAQIDQLEEGLVEALLAQRPSEIGRLGVAQAVTALNGGQPEEQITTGFEVITQDNLDQPEIQDAIYQSEC
jgi:ribose transport system substrate-binding protein